VAPEDSFARFVSLACHDLRTPLATVSGFAHTLNRTESLGEPTQRYLGMILAASEQMGDLLEQLGLVARIEAGRYEPTLTDADTLELARAAAAAFGEEAGAGGSGAGVRVHREPTERALVDLARCALRHGGLERVEIVAEGSVISIAPVTEAGPILLGEELKDLGAAAAGRLVEALGGSLAVEDERLLVRLG
jgi:signal transduction histidine kinase